MSFFINLESEITLQQLASLLRVLYLNINLLGMILSYIYDQNTFKYTFTIWLLEKGLLIISQQNNLPIGMSNLELVICIVFNIFEYQHSFVEEYSFNKTPFTLFPSLAILIYDIILIIGVFFQDSLANVNSLFIGYVFLIQIIIGFAFKASILLLLNVGNLAKFKSFQLLQFAYFFIGTISQQGLLIFSLQSHFSYFLIIAIEILLNICSLSTIIQFKLQFFVCSKVSELAFFLLLLQLFHFPVHFLSFLDKRSFRDIDFNRLVEVSEQISSTIVRLQQLLTSLIMALIILCSDINPQNFIVKFLYEIIILSFLTYSSISLYEVISKLYGIKNKNYKYLHKQSLNLDELEVLLKNSYYLQYLNIDQLNINSQISLDQPQQDYKKKVFINLIRLAKKDSTSIKVGQYFRKQGSPNDYIDGDFFFNEILEWIEEERDIPAINVLLVRQYYLHFEELNYKIIQRFLKYGLDIKFQQFHSAQTGDFKLTLKSIQNEYLSYLLFIRQFYSQISLSLDTNPKQVIFDLYEEYL